MYHLQLCGLGIMLIPVFQVRKWAQYHTINKCSNIIIFLLSSPFLSSPNLSPSAHHTHSKINFFLHPAFPYIHLSTSFFTSDGNTLAFPPPYTHLLTPALILSFSPVTPGEWSLILLKSVPPLQFDAVHPVSQEPYTMN